MNCTEWNVTIPQWGKAAAFHPKITPMPDGRLMMLVQAIYGSDSFGIPSFSFSRDGGLNWAPAEEIRELAEFPVDGYSEGACDMVPFWHRQSGNILALGQNLYYQNHRFVANHPGLKRYGIYIVRRNDGSWMKRRKLDIPRLRDSFRVATGCSQFLEMEDGRLLIPVSASLDGTDNRQVTTHVFNFDGETLEWVSEGSWLANPASRRGLMEPSIVSHLGVYYMTMRAEDGHGYVAKSEDGLHWSASDCWRWDNGEALKMSSTQQHFLPLNQHLFLLYTRDAGFNSKILRFRSPLFIAEIDPDTLRLRQESEQILFAVHGNPACPETVGLLGNFMVTALNPQQALVSDCEIYPSQAQEWGYPGLLRIARLEI